MITIRNTNHWLIELSALHKNNTAVITPEKKISCKELLEECLIAAGYLRGLGIKEKDNVGILFGHKYEFFAIVNALWIIGAVPVPLNTRNTVEEIQMQISQAEIKLLIIDENFKRQFKPLNFQNAVFIKKNTSAQLLNTKSYIQHSAFSIQHSALIMFTSGSSGKSKAVVHTFQSLLESVKSTDSFVNLLNDDIWLASLPLYHIGGFMILVRSLLAGSSVLFPNSLKYEELILSVQQFHPTHISLVSTTLQRFLDEPIQPDQKLKYVFLGGGPSEKQLCLNAMGKGYPIVKVYGSTESCSMITALFPNEIKHRPDSAGKVLGMNKIKIMNKSMSSFSKDVLCKTGEIGEIVVSSKSLFKEYYNDRLTTEDKLKNGWYYTGDYGWLDSEGYLHVEARREDLIITGGENVSAYEVEFAIKSHPKIIDSFVFAIKDETWGQMVCAAVVSKQMNEEEIKNFLKKKIAGYKIPKRFYFVDEIPKSELGKVKRTELFKKLNLR